MPTHSVNSIRRAAATITVLLVLVIQPTANAFKAIPLTCESSTLSVGKLNRILPSRHNIISTEPLSSSFRLNAAKEGPGDDEKKVKVGSEEYYEGFLSRSMSEEPAERVTGDALLGPTFKFVGGGVVIIAALFLGFMVSNGLI